MEFYCGFVVDTLSEPFEFLLPPKVNNEVK